MAAHVRESEIVKAKERQREHGGTAPGVAKNTSAETSEVISSSKTRYSNETRAKVAAIVGMSHYTLTKASTVVEKGTPELVEVMDKRDIPINTAARLATLPPERQREVVAIEPLTQKTPRQWQ